MRYRLVHLSGSLAGHVREIDADQVILGRDPEQAQVVFGTEDNMVSRRHALLIEDDGVLLIRDLGSSTGSFVDGEDVEEAELRHGDIFELGRGGPRIRVELEESGTLIAEPPRVSAPPVVTHPGPTWVGLGSRLRIAFLSGSRKGQTVDLAGSVIRLGRHPDNTVSTPDDRVVSAQHAKIALLKDRYVLIDLESRNGTYLNGCRVERAELATGDVILLGPGGPELAVDIVQPEETDGGHATVMIPHFADFAARQGAAVLVQEVPFPTAGLTLGRGTEAEVRLDSPMVSRRHARLLHDQGGVTIEDLGSANGTYVNGQRIERALVRPGDHVVVGPFEIEVDGDLLRLLDTRTRARLDADGLSVTAGRRVILDQLSLSLSPGSFTAIIGPSGAGKSTLLHALAGTRRADRGHVLLNGVDLYRSFEALKSVLGFVPQDDIVHRELTVGRSLDYTARLRLPPDTSSTERSRRIAQVLATLELSERQDVAIHRLSGGQRKRVSIAAELLTEPSVLFLDEPTSGLDPGLEEALMLLLRELAYKGKTVVLVTHTLENIHLCDALVLLVDGRLAYFGSARQARAYFGIDQITDLYARLKQKPADVWQQEFEKTREPELLGEPIPRESRPEPQVSPARVRQAVGPGPLRQLVLLTQRYLEILTRDARNALLLFGQAPLIAVLIGLSLLYGISDVAYTKPKNTILFLLSLTAVWFGCSNAARELVKERAIYQQERRAGLRVMPYVVSKLLVLAGLALLQCIAFLFVLRAWFGIPGRLAYQLPAMLLASAIGILLGLALSALARTADRAMTLLPLLLIPQVLFTSPAVHMDMQGPAGMVARAMPTWWSFDLLRRIALAPQEAIDDDRIESALQQSRPTLMTKTRFERMLRDGYPMFQYRSSIEVTWVATLPERLGRKLPVGLGYWRPAVGDVVVLIALGAGLLAAASRLQRRHDHRS